VIYADGMKEGITENKMNTLRGARSFIGVTKDNMLVMGTVPNVTVKELAEIVKSMGLTNAMNLDGGASSGLYYKGRYLTTPGRKLSNALVVTKLKTRPKRILLNNKEIILEADPFITNGATMVPVENLAREMGLRLQKDNTGITLYRGNQTLRMAYNKAGIWLDGMEQSFTAPLLNQNGKAFVPIRAFEHLGAVLKVDDAQNAILLQMEVIKPMEAYNQAVSALNAGNRDQAEALLLKAVEADPGLSCALARLYRIYIDRNDAEKAIVYINQYLSLQKDDISAMNSLGWQLLAAKRYEEGLDEFIRITTLTPNDPNAYITVGDIYGYWHFNNPQKSREYYEKALSLNPGDATRNLILRKIEKLPAGE
ncbi:MAG: phosphodiester glycosidase family protein, partial [Clostridia bacterium]|nr:phosphodiester glycosidase family protein [Clostridia bacterium]